MGFLKYFLVFVKRNAQILSTTVIHKKDVCICGTMAEKQAKG